MPAVRTFLVVGLIALAAWTPSRAAERVDLLLVLAADPRRSYDDRPQELNEVTVRLLDAYGTLAWLRTRADVIGDIIGLQGWSNGGSATLATMETGASATPMSLKGFTAALVFYPGCETKVPFANDYRPYAPVRVFHGTADEEVSYRACRALVERARAHGGDIEITLYQNATHDFDALGSWP